MTPTRSLGRAQPGPMGQDLATRRFAGELLSPFPDTTLPLVILPGIFAPQQQSYQDHRGTQTTPP